MRNPSRRALLANAAAFTLASHGISDALACGCGPTAENIEGPFYKKGAPNRDVLVGDAVPGERLLLVGQVLGGGDCRPLPHVAMELWHADHDGAYDIEGYRFRCRLRTDGSGRWQVSTIVPGRYLNGDRYRPSHVHAKLRAKGHRPLTTQLYFAGDPFLEGDPFVVPSLIVPLGQPGGPTRGDFDFVLEPMG